MTELETGLISIVKEYGISALVIALATIFLVGVLKYFNVFAKIKKENRKPIYYVLNYAFVFALAAIYFGIFKVPFTSYAVYSVGVASLVNILYPLYENLKIRDLVCLIGRFIVNKAASNKQRVEQKEDKKVDDNTKEKKQEENKII